MKRKGRSSQMYKRNWWLNREVHKSTWKSVGSPTGLSAESCIVLSGFFPNQAMSFIPHLNHIWEWNATQCSGLPLEMTVMHELQRDCSTRKDGVAEEHSLSHMGCGKEVWGYLWKGEPEKSVVRATGRGHLQGQSGQQPTSPLKAVILPSSSPTEMQVFGTNRYMLLYINYITKKNLLYSTGNYTHYFTYKGK